MSAERDLIEIYDATTDIPWIIERKETEICFIGYRRNYTGDMSVFIGKVSMNDIDIRHTDNLNVLLDSNKYIIQFCDKSYLTIIIENKITGSIYGVKCDVIYHLLGNAVCDIMKYNILHKRKLSSEIANLTNRISEYDNQLALINSKFDMLVNFIDLIVEKSPENLAKIKDIIQG